MDIKYDRVSNCYRTEIRIKVGGDWRYLQPVIDTGATNTTVAFDALVDEDSNTDDIEKLWNKFDSHAKEAGIKRVVIHGAAEELDNSKIYAYDACFDNVFVGGHLMRQFHVKIMMNGAKKFSVIGNDFLNMCRYLHEAGEHRLIVENPDEQKYYASFRGLKTLGNEQVNMLLSNFGSEKEVAVSKEDI